MRQFIYKMIVVVLAIILVYEFTIGKKISQFGGKVEAITSKIFKILETAIEKPHCGASGVPFINKHTSLLLISLSINSLVF